MEFSLWPTSIDAVHIGLIILLVLILIWPSLMGEKSEGYMHSAGEAKRNGFKQLSPSGMAYAGYGPLSKYMQPYYLSHCKPSAVSINPITGQPVPEGEAYHHWALGGRGHNTADQMSGSKSLFDEASAPGITATTPESLAAGRYGVDYASN